MTKDFTIGREDFSITVYVPWNCTNSCPFCSSKKDYNKIKANFKQVKEKLKSLRNSLVNVIVFTGGEPSADVKKLKELVSIVDNKTIFINTTLPKKNSEEFIDFINNTDCIKGVSISRHTTSYEEDSKILKDICEDEKITLIKKPVRINVVELNENQFNIDNIKKNVSRWEKIRKLKSDNYDSLILNLRSNYVIQKKEELHELENSQIVNDLTNNYFYYKHNFCNVCDTCTFFKREDNQRTFVIDYHRGLFTTSLSFGNIIEVNDLILLQDGNLCYDWDGKSDNIERLEYLLNINKEGEK